MERKNWTTKEYQLPDLPYDYKALEPIISGEIMELHHKKHHQGYVTNLNVGLQKYADAEAKRDVGTMIQLQGAIKFNGGIDIHQTKNKAKKKIMPSSFVKRWPRQPFDLLDKLGAS